MKEMKEEQTVPPFHAVGLGHCAVGRGRAGGGVVVGDSELSM